MGLPTMIGFGADYLMRVFFDASGGGCYIPESARVFISIRRPLHNNRTSILRSGQERIGDGAQHHRELGTRDSTDTPAREYVQHAGGGSLARDYYLGGDRRVSVLLVLHSQNLA